MKKIITTALAATLLVAVTGCQKNASSQADDALFTQEFSDSISQYMGYVNGASLAERIKTIPEPEASKVTKAGFLKGFKTVVMADTADLGYIYGLSIALNMANQLQMMEADGLNINRQELYKEFARAFNADTVDRTALENVQAQLGTLMSKAQQRIQEKRQADQAAADEAGKVTVAENEAAGTAYIEQQKADDQTIKTTESGLSYKVIKQGTGAKPSAADKVKVKYTGRLVDGTVFDSSNGEAVEFPLGGVIPGFSEGLQMMNPGSQYVLYIPAALGYGANGTPDGSIPGGSTIVFDVEVVEVIPAN